MNVGTVEQLRILEYIREHVRHFHLSELQVELVEHNSLRVIDKVGDSIIFKYENGEVTFDKL